MLGEAGSAAWASSKTVVFERRLLDYGQVSRWCARRLFFLCFIFCLSASLTAGGGDNGYAAQGEALGVLTGNVTRGPSSPVMDPNVVYAPLPVQGARVRVTKPNGTEVASIATDAQGSFRIDLAPATYRVNLDGLTGGAITKDLPATVNIRTNSETRLDIHVDMRLRGPIK